MTFGYIPPSTWWRPAGDCPARLGRPDDPVRFWGQNGSGRRGKRSDMIAVQEAAAHAHRDQRDRTVAGRPRGTLLPSAMGESDGWNKDPLHGRTGTVREDRGRRSLCG